MAVANTKSTQITNADASPPLTLNDRRVTRGDLRDMGATLEVAAADEDLSVYRFFRVHSSWRIVSLARLNDAITGASDYDLGFYQIKAAGGAVIDKDSIADGVDINAGTVTPVEHLFTTNNVANIEKYVWEIANAGTPYTSDPNIFMDVCWTGNTVGTAAGTISMLMKYVES